MKTGTKTAAALAASWRAEAVQLERQAAQSGDTPVMNGWYEGRAEGLRKCALQIMTLLEGMQS